MNVSMTETLEINGKPISINRLERKFNTMITAVKHGHTLSDEERAYIVEMLEEQRDIEVETVRELALRST